jgi:hypothetical protein
VRQFAGWCSIAGVPLTLASFLMGGTEWGLPTMVLALCAVPALAMIIHLGISDELTPEEKALWRRELWFGHRAVVATWTYVLVQDLKAATRELSNERS